METPKLRKPIEITLTYGCTILRRNHHGHENYVFEHLEGKHRIHCLCYSCAKFEPTVDARNCPRARMLYAFCQLTGMVTPVWECDRYVPTPSLVVPDNPPNDS